MDLEVINRGIGVDLDNRRIGIDLDRSMQFSTIRRPSLTALLGPAHLSYLDNPVHNPVQYVLLP